MRDTRLRTRNVRSNDEASRRAAADVEDHRASVRRGRPRASELGVRHDDLIQVAGELFLARGYSRVSLELISQTARAATRTIYIKFGGKSGLMAAVVACRVEACFRGLDLQRDPRPFDEAIDDFASRLRTLLCSSEAAALDRALADWVSNDTSMQGAGRCLALQRIHDTLADYLRRSDIKEQLRDNLPWCELPSVLIACILGERPMFRRSTVQRCESACDDRAFRDRLALFYRAVLR